MSVFRFLRRHPRRALPLLASLAVASAIALASSASFTTSVAGSASLTAKQLTLGSSGTLTYTNLVPSATAYTQDFVVTNSGGSSAVSLSPGTLSSPAGPNGGSLKDTVTLTITDITHSSQVYTGTFSGIPSSISLGNWSANESRTYRFSVSFPDNGVPSGATTGDNAYQGATLTDTFTWLAAA